MIEPALIRRQRELLKKLTGLVAERARLEPALLRTRQEQQAAVAAEAEKIQQTLTQRCQTECEAADRELAEAQAAAEKAYVTERKAAVKEFKATRTAWKKKYKEDRAATLAAYSEARWTLSAFLDSKKSKAEDKLRDQEAQMTVFTKQVEDLRKQAEEQLQRRKQPLSYLDAPPPQEGKPRKIGTYLAIATKNLDKLRVLSLPRIALFQAGAIRRQLEAVCVPLARALVNARERCGQMMTDFGKQCQRTIRRAKRKHHTELREAFTKAKKQVADIIKTAQQAKFENKDRLRRRVEASERKRPADLAAAEKQHAQRQGTAKQRLERDSRELQARRKQRLEKIEAAHAAQWQGLIRRWQDTRKAAAALAEGMNRSSAQLFPGWDQASWKDWSPARPLTLLESAPLVSTTGEVSPNGAAHVPALPEVLRFGDYEVNVAEMPAALSDVPAQSNPKLLRFPAFRAFPDQCSMLFLAEGEGRARAVAAVQGAMFRLLTSVPPGKVRFTILDPAGLGQNFAAFMDLVDYEEALVNARIWTESDHIEKKLGDLTGHLENVIQTYLRNHYANIMEYNVEAGEVAEPFRVVVVANFPVNFNEEAARRLVQISRNGPRCGVFTLVTVDRKQPLPAGFDLADLESAAMVLEWRDERFHWRDADFQPYPLTLEPGPAETLVPPLLERIGIAAKLASKVEVPFGFVVPPEEQWWSCDSRSLLRVPIGKAGALRRQYLELGKGTSQHVLIAGKTGSGKSSLLNALVTNLALHYSPEEVELYLIDFKKGVEFKSYAINALPHARVVAIESEREFGLSVLQRLDAELVMRGELFRQVNVQDLASYRDLGNKMPRILMVVDEFQEFFTEDDRLSRDSAQMLDRLVRQGRAFGLHVLLGSQTLGGAYSLARSTIDQMGVRIALQLSEADAHLTLSADNGAARLLTRPGEAIYNDANGLVEGNNPFQVVWLSDNEREDYLKKVRIKAGGAGRVPAVFEGNAPATVDGNQSLTRWLHGDPLATDLPRAWLGEAMALTAHTSAVFRRQNGNNLVTLGQNDETVLGMMTTALVSLAAQLPANGGAETPSFYLIDGTQPEAGQGQLWPAVAGALGGRVRLGGFRQAAAFVSQVAEEYTRREQAAATTAPSIFFLIYGLHRCRDLRRPDDDFGYMGKSDAPLTPPQQLANLLREGPGVGIHTLIWCDTLANLQRTFDRTAIRELSWRVALQMNVSDSSTLLDSPVAGKLGDHRALLYNEEEGRMEKFRPYALPTQDWLDAVKARLASSALVEAGR